MNYERKELSQLAMGSKFCLSQIKAKTGKPVHKSLCKQNKAKDFIRL